MAYAEKAGVEISALAYYPNVMTADKEKRNAAVSYTHLESVCKLQKRTWNQDYNSDPGSGRVTG